MPRICGCPDDVGRKLRDPYAKPGTCSCCAQPEPVVQLPVHNTRVNYRMVAFCAACLNPHGARSDAESPHNAPHRYTFEKFRRCRLPASLIRALKRDPDQIRHDHPGAQRQKLAQNMEENFA